ncbi:MAG: SCP2 sterol-binding domain-containing protein [Deltaproteobacteria bacterium]|nr:SCP2 sterol-binding domain-containing protein [Deltaproteobacteria bacterium]
MTDYFELSRTTRPADWFERILPSLPLRLPDTSLDYWSVYHVDGVGSWSVGLQGGKVAVRKGVAEPVGVQIRMTAGHFREAMFGAVRDRLAEVLTRLGKPRALPDLARLAIDPRQVAATVAVGGHLAVVLRDRAMGDEYQFAITIGGEPAGPPTTTIVADLDDLVTLAAARTPPHKLLTGGKLRISGDLDRPAKLLTALLAAAKPTA